MNGVGITILKFGEGCMQAALHDITLHIISLHYIIPVWSHEMVGKGSGGDSNSVRVVYVCMVWYAVECVSTYLEHGLQPYVTEQCAVFVPIFRNLSVS